MGETMYESRDAMPVYQSTDLDFDAARAEWERQGEVRFPTGEELAAMDAAAAREADRLSTAGQQTPTDTPDQIARASMASYREMTERYGQSPDEATEAAIREVLEGLAVDVAAERARLVAALEDAERAARTLPDERHALLVTYQASSTGLSAAEWDRIAEDFDATADEVRRKVGDAWDALQAFDEATKGDE